MRRARQGLDEITLLRAWCDWSSRSRGEYLEAILRLPVKERRKDRGASWGSIEDIFLHVIEDYLWWFENVPEGRFDESEELVGRNLSEREIRRLTKRAERSVNKMMDALSPSDLRRPLPIRGVSGDGEPYEFTSCLADIVWHMVEEELQHRGELNALFWQMDMDPPLRSWFSSPASLEGLGRGAPESH